MVGLSSAGSAREFAHHGKSAILRYCGVTVKDRRTVELEKENEALKSKLGDLAAENRKLKWTLHALHEEPEATRSPWLESRCPICVPPSAVPALKFALTPNMCMDTPLMAPQPDPVACDRSEHRGQRPMVPAIPIGSGRTDTSGLASTPGPLSGREPLKQISNRGKEEIGKEGAEPVEAILSDLTHHAEQLLRDGPPLAVGPQTLQAWRCARDYLEESLRARLPDESARSLALDMAMSPGRSTSRRSSLGSLAPSTGWCSSQPLYSIGSALSPEQSPERSPWRRSPRRLQESPRRLQESPRYYNLDSNRENA